MKPLIRRDRGSTDRESIKKAIERLDGSTWGLEQSDIVKNAVNALRNEKSDTLYKKPTLVAQKVKVIRALYDTRQISAAEYVHRAGWEAEMILEERQRSGKYKEGLSPIEQAMRRMQKAAGIKSGEYWPNEVPEEYRALERQWESVLDQEYVGILRELGLTDLEDMMQHDPAKLERLRERGRRLVKDQNEYIGALHDVVVHYEKDAKRAAAANAYAAAITLLGAGAEGLLLLRCMQSKQKACRIAKKLGNKIRPRYPEDPNTWTFEQLIQVCLSADWLPIINGRRGWLFTVTLVQMLRDMRNLVHPGRLVRKQPWFEGDERQYLDAEAIYKVLLTTVGANRKKRVKHINMVNL